MVNQKTNKIFVVFHTKSQIKDVNKAKKNKEKFDLIINPIQLKETCFPIISLNNKIEDIKKKKKVDLKFSKTQFKKTFNHVTRLNNVKKRQLLKEENKKKLDKIIKNTIKNIRKIGLNLKRKY